MKRLFLTLCLILSLAINANAGIFDGIYSDNANITSGTISGTTINNSTIGGTTPAAGTFSPVKAKGPAIITTFAGTVTATASTTVTFSSAADAILAGYSATNPILGTTLISNALTRYIVSWTNATTCVVDTAVTWAGTAITSVQLPIATFVDSDGIIAGWISATRRIVLNPLGIVKFSFGTVSGTRDFTTADTFIMGDASGNNYIQLAGTTMNIQGYSNIIFITNAEAGRFTAAGNFLIGGLTAAGTSAAKVLAMGSGTAPTTSPADAGQMYVKDYNDVAGDARFNFRGEASAVKTTAIGSGTVSVKGAVASGGGLTRQLAEATSGALSGATGSIAVNVPSGSRILGVQLRVDTLITSDIGTSWSAIYVNTPTTAICALQAFDANTKFNAIHPTYEITTGTVTITVAPNAGTFTAGVVRAIVYYESLDNMASL